VISDARHPGTVRGRALDIQAEVAPHFWLRRLILVGVAKVPVHEVKEGSQRFDLINRVERVVLRLSPLCTRERQAGSPQITETREHEGGATRRRSGKRTHAAGGKGAGWAGAVTDLVRIGGIGAQSCQRGVVREDLLAADAVGVGLQCWCHG
jgi:hypothetical protein